MKGEFKAALATASFLLALGVGSILSVPSALPCARPRRRSSSAKRRVR